MTELPNTVTEAQMQLREAMRYSTDPAWLERQLSPGPDEIIRSGRRLAYWTVGIIGGCAAVCIVFALFAFGAFASEPPRDWVVFNLSAGTPWVNPKTGLPATATGPTACSLALYEVSTAVPAGTRLSCVRKN